MKEALCKAFCDNLSVRSVRDGLAVSVPFDSANGEPIGFYIIADSVGKFHIEDDGTTVPMLEASGVDFTTETRSQAFQELLDECGAVFDSNRRDLRTLSIPEEDIPETARRFSSLLLRMQDFLLLTPDRVFGAFRADATRAIKLLMAERAEIRDNAILAEALQEFPADLVIRANSRAPVAVIFGTSEQRVSEAIMLQMAAQYEAHVPCSVIALVEDATLLSNRTRTRAANRLSALPSYKGDEHAAIARIEREVFGFSTQVAGHA